MSKTKRTFKGGSIVNFVVIGVILSVLLVGGIYLIKQRGEQVRKEQAIAEYEKQKESEEKNNTKSEVTDDTTSNSNGSDTGSTVAPSTNESSELPQTGADINIIELAGLFGVTFAMVSCLMSIKKTGTIRY